MTGGSICDVLPGAAALLGVPGAADRLGLSALAERVDRVVVIVVDGMGYHLLPRMVAHAPLVADVLRGTSGRLTELQCTFPSTTPTSLVSLGTGVPPGAHGVLGFTLNIPGTDRVLTHIFWRDDPPPRQWQPERTWFERVTAAGRSARIVLPAAFQGSGLTDAAYRGADFCGVLPDEDYAERLADEVSLSAGLIVGYTAALDTAAHFSGIASERWAHAAAGVDRLLRTVLERLPPNSAVLVSADHGGLDIAADARIDIADDARLAAGIRVVAGEPRVRYLHTVDGASADVCATWRAVLGERAQVLERDEAIESGLFGPVAAAHRTRLGDVIVICVADIAVLATGHEPPEIAKLIGFHGAATSAEMAIPLMAFVS